MQVSLKLLVPYNVLNQSKFMVVYTNFACHVDIGAELNRSVFFTQRSAASSNMNFLPLGKNVRALVSKGTSEKLYSFSSSKWLD